MADYEPVRQALAQGADAAMLCATCPWDRNCITPPTMTRAEVDAQIEEAAKKDEAAAREAQLAGREAPMPAGALLTVMVMAGKDTAATLCPVLALRLRTSGGKEIAEALKASMQRWDDQE